MESNSLRSTTGDAIPKEPRFSVVIPAFNAERTIGATLRSVLIQSCGDFEVVVVDDGSTDSTARCVAEIADPRIGLVRQRNSGQSAARNVGIEATRGPYVSFLDADDVWLPGYLETMGEALDTHPQAGFAFTDAWTWHEAVGRFGRQTIVEPVGPPATVPGEARELFRQLLLANFVFVSATVRRSVLDHVGGFKTSVSPAEDWEMWLRIASFGYGAVRSRTPLAVYRVRAGSLSSDRAAMLAAGRRVFETAVADHPLDEEQRELVRMRLDVYGGSMHAGRRERRSRWMRTARRLLWMRHYRILRPKAIPASVANLLTGDQRRS